MYTYHCPAVTFVEEDLNFIVNVIELNDRDCARGNFQTDCNMQKYARNYSFITALTPLVKFMRRE